MKQNINNLWGVAKQPYTTPSASVHEFSADAAIMQMSTESIPGLGETTTNPGDAIWS